MVLAGGGFAGYKCLYQPDAHALMPQDPRLSTAASAPAFNAALGKWQQVQTRALDLQPLTQEQLFPPQFRLSGSSFVNAAATVTSTCTLAVYGAAVTGPKETIAPLAAPKGRRTS